MKDSEFSAHMLAGASPLQPQHWRPAAVLQGRHAVPWGGEATQTQHAHAGMQTYEAAHAQARVTSILANVPLPPGVSGESKTFAYSYTYGSNWLLGLDSFPAAFKQLAMDDIVTGEGLFCGLTLALAC